MPSQKREEHRIDLTAAERERLDELAQQTGSRVLRGSERGEHNWKMLIRRIARGEVNVVERNPYKLPPGLDEAIERNEADERKAAAKTMAEWKQSSLLESVN